MNLKKQTIGKFMQLLSSTKPTPGGGTTAALTAAFSVVLIRKVAKLTLGKKGYENVEERMNQINKISRNYELKLISLAQEDSKAFEQVYKSYRLEKNNPERKSKIEKALKYAAEIPFQVAKICEEIALLAEETAKSGNKNAYSDAKSAEYFAVAAKRSAMENVKINIANIQDLEWLKKMNLLR